jgi:hypothetical protein
MEGGKMSSRKIFGLIPALMLGLLLIPLDSHAVLYTWNGGDGNWTDNTKWNPNGVPANNLPSFEAYVRIDNNPGINSTVTYDGYGLGWANVAGLTVDAGDTLLILYGTSVENNAQAATVLNNGTIQLSTGGGSSAFFGCGNSTVHLTGSGNLVLGPPNGDNRCIMGNGGAGGTFINHAPHIIRGAGEIGFWLTNQSRIIAENGTFYIAATIYNTGGTMEVNGPGNAFHLNTEVIGGEILPGLGQVILDRIQLSNLTLGPGAVTLDPHSQIFNRVGAGVTFPAGTEVTVPAGVAFNLGTAVHSTDPGVTIVNHGVIRLTGGGAQLNSRNAKLSGMGRVVLGGDLNNAFTGTDFSTPGYFTLENDAGHTIEGGGTLVCKIITNNGAIAANNGPLRIYTGSSGSQVSVTGTGTITVAPNASLEAGGLIHLGGGGVDIGCLTTNNGTLAANNGTLRLYASVLGGGQITVADNCSLEVYNGVQAGALSLSPLASLSVGAGTLHGFLLSGDFTFAQTDPARWNWGANTGLIMGGSGDWQSVEVGGRDLGAVPAGFTNNFALPALELWNLDPPSVARAYLSDQVDNGHRAGQREALYVNSLWVDPGTTLNLNHLHLYTYLNGSVHQVQPGEGGLFGGGQIINLPLKPITAPVNSLLLLTD